MSSAPRLSTRTRKLIGTIVLVIFVCVYVVVAAVIGSGRVLEAPLPFKLAYFVVAGLLWVLPAGLLLRWMQKPDARKSS